MPASDQVIGRDGQRAALREALAEGWNEHGRALLLVAEAGAGKTVLLDETARAAAAGYRVLRCRGLEAEFEFPFSSLHALLAPLLASRIAVDDDAELEPLRSALGATSSSGSDPIAVGMAALALLSEAADREDPVLLLIDDLHWVDDASRRVLAFISRRIAHDRVMMVLASRPEGDGDDFDAERITLPPLTSAEIGELAVRLRDEPLPSDVIDGLWRLTGGNPLAACELLRSDEAALPLLGSGIETPPAVGDVIGAAFERRLQRLPTATIRAVELLAVSISDEPRELLAAIEAIGLSGADLDAAERANVVRRIDGQLSFSHPLLRATVYHRCDPVQRRACHAALSATSGDRAVSAWHAAAAADGPDDEVASRLAEVAQRFAERGGVVASARALELAARLTTDPRVRGERLLDASQAAQDAARHDWARRLLNEAALCDDPVVAIRAHHGQVWSDAVTGLAPGDLVARIRQAEQAARGVDPRSHRALLSMLVDEAILSGRLEVALSVLPQLDDLAYDSESAASIATRWGPSASTRMLSGIDTESAEAATVHTADLLLELPPTRHSISPSERLIWIEHFDTARKLLGALHHHAEATGRHLWLSECLSVDGYLHYRTGEWTRAAMLLEQARERTRADGSDWDYAMATIQLAVVRGSQGDAAAEQLVAEVEPRLQRGGYQLMELYGATALGLLALATGDAERAVVQLTRARDWARAAGYREPGVLPWMGDLPDAHLAAGDPEAARAALGELREAADRTGRRWARAAVARIEGALEVDDARAEARLQEAVLLSEAATAPFDRARAQLQLGRRLRRRGQRVKARVALEDALRSFRQLGASAWVAQAADELRASGVELDATAAGDPLAELTPTERIVAGCVAEGLTNKEIAARLFVTPKTIEWHLRQTYRKLGIRSRVQLSQLIEAPS